MLDHVLVPLDTSSLAELALPYALEIVSLEGQMTLLTVIVDTRWVFWAAGTDFDGGGVVASALTQSEQEQYRLAQDYLNQIAARIERPGLKVTKMVEVGMPAETIVEAARTLEVQVIVMSTRGRRGLARWLFGSVTHQVVKSAPCPIFVIPQTAKSRLART